jgi:peptidoglycan/xylan/chitin deacetylase (PgdA/CDA1 family)
MTLDYKKLLQGYYEAERLPQDFSDNRLVPDCAFNVLNPLGLLYRPIVDEDHISKTSKNPEWPDGKSFAVCLTHDVDDVSLFSITQSLRAYRKPFGGLDLTVDKLKRVFGLGLNTVQALKNLRGNDPLHCYERWLEIEKEFHAKSTFFFWPGWSNVTKHHHTDSTYEFNDRVEFDGQTCSVMEMLREIYRRGWEIGLHPSWYSFNDKDELKRQKEALENALDQTIFSVRQHFLHYDIRKTPRVHSDAGIKYDSTLGFNDNIGFRFGTCYPWKLHDILNNEQLHILEIPLIIQDVAMLHPSKGMRIDPIMAFEYFVLLAKRVEKVGGVLTLLWHPNEIINRKSWQLYLRILNYIREKKAWITSVQEIGNWWLR